MLVNVTKRDIKNGKADAPKECPIALAIKRHKGISNVRVGWLAVGFTKGATSKGCRLPPNVQEWIQDFDDGLRVKPFKFTLEVE